MAFLKSGLAEIVNKVQWAVCIKAYQEPKPLPYGILPRNPCTWKA